MTKKFIKCILLVLLLCGLYSTSFAENVQRIDFKNLERVYYDTNNGWALQISDGTVYLQDPDTNEVSILEWEKFKPTNTLSGKTFVFSQSQKNHIWKLTFTSKNSLIYENDSKKITFTCVGKTNEDLWNYRIYGTSNLR